MFDGESRPARSRALVFYSSIEELTLSWTEDEESQGSRVRTHRGCRHIRRGRISLRAHFLFFFAFVIYFLNWSSNCPDRSGPPWSFLNPFSSMNETAFVCSAILRFLSSLFGMYPFLGMKPAFLSNDFTT